MVSENPASTAAAPVVGETDESAEATTAAPEPALIDAAGRLPTWQRWFGLASIAIAIGTSVLVGRFAWQSWFDALLYLAMKLLSATDQGIEVPYMLLRGTLTAWVSGVGVSMLVLLVAGILAVAGSRRTRGVHLAAAGLILVATLGTFIALSVWIFHGAAEPQPPIQYACVAIGQSLWAWVSMGVFFTKPGQ